MLTLTEQNRNESYELVEKKKKAQIVLESLNLEPLTARQLSKKLRWPINCIVGRIKELREEEKVTIAGKVYDNRTNRHVAVYVSSTYEGQLPMLIHFEKNPKVKWDDKLVLEALQSLTIDDMHNFEGFIKKFKKERNIK